MAAGDGEGGPTVLSRNNCHDLLSISMRGMWMGREQGTLQILVIMLSFAVAICEILVANCQCLDSQRVPSLLPLYHNPQTSSSFYQEATFFLSYSLK